ncbi:acetyl/propionyl/methylcrotonyl-CoA carboxylase subunit alpha [Marinibaculum pumilum]|uniref:Acetyl/propionyl/methylcrotonyl-CoA carboxylase subunit alpha n=1 Tax=Marinibaculum pumilum TaxID=1766165 RepID=A0ABV7L461_9PROT
MKKVLIANRGEIACRVMRSCRDLGLATVAVHSEADAAAMHVAEADQAVAIGPAKAAESYLVAEKILAAAKETGADAIHPGYGFLAENERFAEAVEKAGLVWIGPRPKTIADMGDKERARALAHAAGVPILPGSARFAPGDNDGLAEAGREVGYPLLVKAAAGGGGIGMRKVDAPDDLEKVVASTQELAAKAFGDGTVYLEHFVSPARHVEIQVFGFGDGRAVHVFERDCSVQRRYQKIVEESPAPGLSDKTRMAMADAAAALARSERYRGAGTVEFVVGPDEGFYFLEMNTRIQVEHPVTEMLTGLDLVAMQIRLAAGEHMADVTQDSITATGAAVEARIYAERPEKNFLPSPGPLKRFAAPEAAADLRIDTGVREGDQITFYYDPMIAKVVAHGADRNAAIDRLDAALAAFEVDGVGTNIAFLRRLLAHPEFRAGGVSTGFVGERIKELTT